MQKEKMVPYQELPPGWTVYRVDMGPFHDDRFYGLHLATDAKTDHQPTYGMALTRAWFHYRLTAK